MLLLAARPQAVSPTSTNFSTIIATHLYISHEPHELQTVFADNPNQPRLFSFQRRKNPREIVQFPTNPPLLHFQWQQRSPSRHILPPKEDMVHISNSLISFLNILTLLISVPIIGIGLWLRYQAASGCEQILLWPIIITGLFLMVVALLGLFGSCCNVSCFLWIYLSVMFVMIVGLFCITVFAILVTNKGVGEAVSGKGYKEYRLGDYSNWLQNRVGDFQTWRRIKSCLIDARVCGGLQLLVLQDSNDLYSPGLSSIQSGCCKPPLSCGFKQVNATTWKVPKSGPNSDDADCKTWSNDQNTLCFDCSSCKAGVLANIKVQWRKIAIFNVCLLVFLIATYSIGCCALRNSCKDNQYMRYN